MNWIQTKNLVINFNQKDKSTVLEVKNRLIPMLADEANLLEDCDRQYMAAGLEPLFRKTIIELRQHIKIGHQRLANSILFETMREN